MLKFGIKALSIACTVELLHHFTPILKHSRGYPQALKISIEKFVVVNRSRVFFSEQELSIIAHDIISEEVNKQGLHDGKRVQHAKVS